MNLTCNALQAWVVARTVRQATIRLTSLQAVLSFTLTAAMTVFTTAQKSVTVKGNTGDDTVYGDSGTYGVVYQYAAGDGYDVIYNYKAADTISIGGSAQ